MSWGIQDVLVTLPPLLNYWYILSLASPPSSCFLVSISLLWLQGLLSKSRFDHICLLLKFCSGFPLLLGSTSSGLLGSHPSELSSPIFPSFLPPWICGPEFLENVPSNLRLAGLCTCSSLYLVLPPIPFPLMLPLPCPTLLGLWPDESSP